MIIKEKGEGRWHFSKGKISIQGEKKKGGYHTRLGILTIPLRREVGTPPNEKKRVSGEKGGLASGAYVLSCGHKKKESYHKGAEAEGKDQSIMVWKELYRHTLLSQTNKGGRFTLARGGNPEGKEK